MQNLFPFVVEYLLTECFGSIPNNVRSVLNASICTDLINEVRTKQESRLSFDVSYSDVTNIRKKISNWVSNPQSITLV